MRNATRYLAGGLLFTGLILPGVASYVAVYFTMAFMLVGLGLSRFGTRLRSPRAPYAALLAGFALILIALVVTYRSPLDLVGPLAVLPLLFAPGVASLLDTRPLRFTPVVFASLCLVGAGLGVASGLAEMALFQPMRVGVGNNPIHFASLTLLLGFMALTGLPGNPSPWRLVFLCGPLLGLAAAMLSGSRGPMFAAGLMGAASFPFLLLWARADRKLLVFLALVAVGGVFALSALGLSRSASVIEAVTRIWQDGFAGAGDVIRSAMYQSALAAFREAPLFGHGLGQMMEAAMAVATPEQQALMAGYDNLHSDIANFAVFAGVAGLCAYGLFLLAPLLLLTTGAMAPVRLGAILLASGFLALGLTNGMFGVLPQTALFAMLLGCLCTLALPPADALYREARDPTAT